MTNPFLDIAALRRRMALGEPVEGDVSWCRRRLKALDEWPVELTYAQTQEYEQLQSWLLEYAE